MLLPEALQEWLPEGHLAYFIGDTADGLDPRFPPQEPDERGGAPSSD